VEIHPQFQSNTKFHPLIAQTAQCNPNTITLTRLLLPCSLKYAVQRALENSETLRELATVSVSVEGKTISSGTMFANRQSSFATPRDKHLHCQGQAGYHESSTQNCEDRNRTGEVNCLPREPLRGHLPGPCPLLQPFGGATADHGLKAETEGPEDWSLTHS
jgi:hypothetical protein